MSERMDLLLPDGILGRFQASSEVLTRGRGLVYQNDAFKPEESSSTMLTCPVAWLSLRLKHMP